MAERVDRWTALERRLEALEKAAEHCADPEDRQADIELRNLLKTIKAVGRAFGWLLVGLKYGGTLLGLLVGIKIASDYLIEWATSWWQR